MNSEETIVVQWKDIDGFRKYEISNEGKVKNKRSGRQVKPCYDGSYWRVSLSGDVKNEKGKFPRRKFALHRLIAQAFITNDDQKRIYIDHIDSNRDNFDISNLRWVTASENKTYGHDTKGRKAIIQFTINGEFVKKWESAAQIKQQHPEYNVKHISSCCLKRPKVKSHRGFKWEYEIKSVKRIVRDLCEDEIFVNIGQFDDYDFSDYFVSNYGMIKNIRGMVLTPFASKGYETYHIYDKKTKKNHEIKAHRAVALKFCEGRTKDKNVVNHINEKRKDNYFKNLEWVTAKENSEYSTAKKVDKLTMDGEFIETFRSMSLAAASISERAAPGDISKCCSGVKGRPSAYGFRWRFAKSLIP